jgi:hypothetical protein
MNKEFKKIKNKLETRYVLEAASAGATSAGAVATGPTGKKGNLLVQDKDGKPEIQRRNPVAANVNATVGGGGAGAHTDRKKKDKRIRGEKHKNAWKRDLSESANIDELEFALRQAREITKAIKYDDTVMDIIGQIQTLANKLNLDPLSMKLFKGDIDDVIEARNKLMSAVYGLEDVFKSALLDAESKNTDEDYGAGGYMTASGGQQISKAVPEGEEDISISQAILETAIDQGYVDQENDMLGSDLRALYTQTVRLGKLIQKMGSNTTIEPWQQTKIAKAADYVNSVFRNLDNEYGLDNLAEAEKKGLWANIHARRKKGLPPRKPGEKGAPTQKSWNAAVAASKKKVSEIDLQEYEKHRYTDDDGNEWEVDDEGNKTLLSRSGYSGGLRIGGYKPRFPKKYNPLPRKTLPKVYYFYNVPAGSDTVATNLGLQKTKSGKWYSRSPIDAATKEFGNPRRWEPKTKESTTPTDSSDPNVRYFYQVPDGRATEAFAMGLTRLKLGKWYSIGRRNAKAEFKFGNGKKTVSAVSEKMMPASHFAGTPKHKLGPAAQLKGKMKRPARQGDLVGGDAEESVVNELIYPTKKVSSSQYAHSKMYKSLGSHGRYNIFVSNAPFKKGSLKKHYMAVAEHPRTFETPFKTKSKNPDDAVNELKQLIDQSIEQAQKVSQSATVDFNVDFANETLPSINLEPDDFYAKIIEGPKLVIAGDQVLEFPEILKSDGFQKGSIRSGGTSETAAKLPSIPLSSSRAKAANLIANGRYVIKNEQRDKDGNFVYDLEFDSIVSSPNEKVKMGEPALTIGTTRNYPRSSGK